MNGRATVSVDGKIADGREAVVSVFDHGFLYGAGVYETLRTYGREPFLFERHIDRLRASAGRIALDVPFDDERLRGRTAQTIAAHAPAGEVYLRILLTRGVGELSYAPGACPQPTLVVIVKDWVERPDRERTEGISLGLVGVRRNAADALDPRIKSNNLLNNVLAMQEALRAGHDEALMLNPAGFVSECAQASFFVVRGGAVRTPPLADGLLAGITRGLVLELAREAGIPVVEESIAPSELADAEESFVTSTTREITPVTRIDGRAIAAGEPGPLTRRLLALFRGRTGLPLDGARRV